MPVDGAPVADRGGLLILDCHHWKLEWGEQWLADFGQSPRGNQFGELIQRDRLVKATLSGPDPAELDQVCANPKCRTDILGECSDVGSRRASDPNPEIKCRQRFGWRDNLEQVEGEDIDADRRAFNLLPGACQLVEPPAGQFLGRIHRWNLSLRATEACHGRGDLFARQPPWIDCLTDRTPGQIPGLGAPAEPDGCQILLVVSGEKLHQPGGLIDADHEDPGGKRVECSGVANAACFEDSPHLRDDVVRCPASRLVDDENCIEAAGTVWRRRFSLARQAVQIFIVMMIMRGHRILHS